MHMQYYVIVLLGAQWSDAQWFSLNYCARRATGGRAERLEPELMNLGAKPCTIVRGKGRRPGVQTWPSHSPEGSGPGITSGGFHSCATADAQVWVETSQQNVAAPMNENTGQGDQLLRVLDLLTALQGVWEEQLAAYNLSATEFRVLLVCARYPNCTAVQVADLAPVDPSTVSRTVQRLYERRLLARRRSRVDRRTVALRVTPEGQAMAQRATQSLQQMEDALVGVLSQPELRSIESMAGRIAAWVETRI